MSASVVESPWMPLSVAAAYERRGKRWLAREAKRGRVRAAIVGGRQELFFRKEWLDAHLEAMATPIEILRRRAS